VDDDESSDDSCCSMSGLSLCPSPPQVFVWFNVGLLDGLSVGDLEGVRVGSLDRGEMVGEPAGRAGQNVGQALATSDCFVVEMEAVTCA
jgi:hypothetical protein